MMRYILVLLLPAVAVAAWRDCGASNSSVHFTSIVSSPDPLHTGETQTITKKGWSDRDFPANVSSVFSQYWCFTDCTDKDGKIKWNTGLPWVRFLKITVDVCTDHPDMCPLAKGKNFTSVDVHPKLNPLTPHGWYRSLQEYHDKATGEYVGCADMIFQYISATDDSDAMLVPADSRVVPELTEDEDQRVKPLQDQAGDQCAGCTASPFNPARCACGCAGYKAAACCCKGGLPKPCLACANTEWCYHTEDAADHKCYEGCATDTFQNKGLSLQGRCPAQYGVVETSKVVEQCKDGVTNLKWCAAGSKVNVTMAIKGEGT